MPSEQPATIDRPTAAAIAASAEQRRRRHAADSALHRIEAILRNTDIDPHTALAKVYQITTDHFCRDAET